MIVFSQVILAQMQSDCYNLLNITIKNREFDTCRGIPTCINYYKFHVQWAKRHYYALGIWLK